MFLEVGTLVAMKLTSFALDVDNYNLARKREEVRAEIRRLRGEEQMVELPWLKPAAYYTEKEASIIAGALEPVEDILLRGVERALVTEVTE